MIICMKAEETVECAAAAELTGRALKNPYWDTYQAKVTLSNTQKLNLLLY